MNDSSAVEPFGESGAEWLPDTHFPQVVDDEGRRNYDLRQEFARRPLAGSPGRERFDQPRRGRRASSEAIHVRQQVAPSWFTPAGVRAKLKQIERKGLPSFFGWRFITLSIDPERFDHCPLTAWLRCRDQIRRFLEAGRLGWVDDDGAQCPPLWDRAARWCWKLEFQANGWAHWHICLDRKAKFSHAELGRIRKLWQWGRTNVRRISKGDFGYQFKYVFKGVYQEGEERDLCVPQWFLDYHGEKQVDVKWTDADGVEHCEKAMKPDTAGRVRFWQTSKGFYEKPSTSERPGKPQWVFVPWLASDVVKASRQRVVVCAREMSGRYIKGRSITLTITFQEFTRRHLWDVEHGAALVLSARSFVCAPSTVEKSTNPLDKCHLRQLQPQNRMTLRNAQRLRREHKDLATC